MSQITYLKAGVYRVPALYIPKHRGLNRYAMLRKRFLQEQVPDLYYALLLDGSLYSHLDKVGEETERLINEHILLFYESSSHKGKRARYLLKARKRAEEIVFPETIYRLY